MAGSSDPIGSISQILLSPEHRAQLSQLMGGVQQQTDAAVNNTQTNFQQFDPRLSTAFAPSQGLDAMSQGLVSAGQEQLRGQQSSRNAAIHQQFGQRQPGLANVLGFQNAFRSSAAANPLSFMASAQQQGREMQNWQANNAARLAQSQQGSYLQQLANQAQQGLLGARQSSLATIAAGMALASPKSTQPGDGSPVAADGGGTSNLSALALGPRVAPLGGTAREDGIIYDSRGQRVGRWR